MVSCYAAAGFTFGTLTAGVATPAAILLCNAGLGKCMASCFVATILAPWYYITIDLIFYTIIVLLISLFFISLIW